MDRTVELSEAQLRQLSDSVAAWRNLEAAQQAAAVVRGSMRWKTVRDRRYLVRASTRGAETSLGPEDENTRQIHESFATRKAATQARLKAMRETVAEHQRLNRALRVGRTPTVVVRCLNALQTAGLAQDFMAVGTHALYAYETAAGVRVESGATATQDLDLFFDVGRLRAYAHSLERSDAKSLVAVLQRADRSFRVKRSQLQTAVNDAGFEVDIVRRVATGDDPHPLRMSDEEDDFWAVQVNQGQALAGARRFAHIVVASTGEMALMRTLHPLDFVRLKTQLAALPGRDPLKAPKDRLQARVVQRLWEERLRWLDDETSGS